VFSLVISKERVDFHKTWYEQNATGELVSTSSYKSQPQIGRLER